MKYLLTTLAASLCVLGLTACGSSDNVTGASAGPQSADACTSAVPDSALSSVAGLISYTTQLIGMSSETSEPIAVCNAVLPTDDQAEPSS